MKMLFDTHAHLNDTNYSQEELEALIEEIEASLVCKLVDIGFDIQSSKLAVEHANCYPWCYAAVGVHPHDTDHMTEADYQEIRRLALSSAKVKAIGEIGLDYYYDKDWADDQRYWFRRQIQLANELALPIVVHARDADRETMDILIEEGAFSEKRKASFKDGTPHVVIHCYSGSAEFAKEYIKLGAMFGIDGPVTFKNNRKTVEVVELVGIEHLLIETDAPYLAPVPFRGKPNKSPYVEHVARKIAEIKGMSFEETARITCENAVKFFIIDESV